MTDLYILMLINLTIIFIVYSYTYNKLAEKELKKFYFYKELLIFQIRKKKYKNLEDGLKLELIYVKEVINNLKQF